MARMTTQQRLDCLLKHLEGRVERQGAGVSLVAQDLTLLMERCGFKDVHEIAFYIRAMDKEGHLDSECSADNTILEASITIDGYRRLDTLRE